MARRSRSTSGPGERSLIIHRLSGCGTAREAWPSACLIRKAGRIFPRPRGIATTGHTAAPNIERILSLDPTLVILAANMEKQRALKDILDGVGIETLLLSYETYADHISILDLFYRLNGGNFSADTGARAVVDKVDAICALTRGRPVPRFLSIFASTFDA